jgi:hypothetical protein
MHRSIVSVTGRNAGDFERFGGHAASAQLHFAARADDDRRAGGVDGRLARDHRPAEFLGLVLQARGDVDGVADHRKLPPARRADVTQQHFSAVYAYAYGEFGQALGGVVLTDPPAKF